MKTSGRQHLFLTGGIQTGKSTLLSRWLSRIDCRIGGFYTRKVPENEHVYVRIFPAYPYAKPVDDNRLFDTLHKDALDSDKQFNTVGCSMLEDSRGAELIVMDEIGYKEDTASAFCEAVLRTLDGTVPVIGVLRKRTPDRTAEALSGALTEIIRSRSDVTVLEVTEANRDELALSLPDILLPFSDQVADDGTCHS